MMDSKITDELLRAAYERGSRYLDGLETRSVFPAKDAVEELARFDEPLPDAPSDPRNVLHMLDEIGSPATVASAGPRYFGFVTGGALPASLAANWLAGAWDQNTAFQIMSPIAAKLEQVALRWLLDVLSLPPDSGGGFTTGATMANFTGLAAARHRLLANAGWDVEAQGLFGAPPITVVVSDEVHASMVKALSLVGFGRQRVLRVPTDNQGRMRADSLPKLDAITLVCTQAGNVNTGAFDPIGDICAAAHELNAWVHVDGAFGLWAAAAPGLAHLTKGVEQADSWAMDAHKWLNVPYDSGLTFCRDADALRAAMSASAAYLIQGEQREPAQYVPEFSRRGRGIEIWAALRSLGRSGLADLIERNCLYARRFADGLCEAGYEVLNDVELNQVMVAFGDEDDTRKIIAGVQEEGTCWCGGTVWQSNTAMRISVSSWATTDEDVERSLDAIHRVAAMVKKSHI